MAADLNNQPLRHSYSHEEAIEEAKTYMRENYGSIAGMTTDEADRYYARLGLLVDFIHHLHPPEPK
jgi:hypothetical protein